MPNIKYDWFYLILIFFDAILMARPYLYVIQQDNYRISEILKSRRIKQVYIIDLCAVSVFGVAWFLCYYFNAGAFWCFLVMLFFFLTQYIFYFIEELPERKKPLKYTKRVMRFMIFSGILMTISVFGVLFLVAKYVENEYFRYIVYLGYSLLYPLLFIIFGNIINFFEKFNNLRYEYRCAQALSSQDDLIKIAITGSYGKTSVKNFLHVILSQKYCVLTTPESYNTPMGIAKTVNNLDGTQEIFIAEMGARRVGDIKKLMGIVKPKYSILTGINSQHLETFKSIENIKREKCRVLEVDDYVVANGRLRDIVELHVSKRKAMPDVIYAGLGVDDDVYADNISMSECGSEFDIMLDNKRYHAHTSLIGRHNIENIMLAVAMAIILDVEMDKIIRGIDMISPIPHRMQLINGNGINIIDDSFNSNPDGARCSIEALRLFDTRRVVVTPGLVELGEREIEENTILGINMAQVADVVLLVGKGRTEAIRQGLQEGGFAGEIHNYDTLKDCEDDFCRTLHYGDTLLLLNDLPDIYDEK